MSRRSKSIAVLLRAGAMLGFAAGVAADVPYEPRNQSAEVSRPVTDDWPMWGGTPARNMVSAGKNPPVHWNLEKNENILWKADICSHSLGSPIVADGVVYVGTNNEGHRDPAQRQDAGVLMAFDAATGEFLWQRLSDKLAAGRVNDWPGIGLCSPAFVEKGRLWYCTNRCEVVCLDVREGRQQHTAPHVLWSVDMRTQLGVFPHNMTRTGITAHGENIYVITGNGVEDTHRYVVAPHAPAIVCFDKNSGEVVWSDNSPGKNILHGQWSSVAIASVNSRALVIAPLGDAWVYAYDAATGKIVWRFDANPKSATYPTIRNEILATPVIVNNRMYLATGQDPEHGEGSGDFWCVDITRTGDVSAEIDDEPDKGNADNSGKPRNDARPRKGIPNRNSAVVWRFGPGNRNIPRGQKMNRSISTAAVANGLVFCPDFSGYLRCLDANTGRLYWSHDLQSEIWSSPLVCDGKVYIGDEGGDVVVMAAEKTEKLISTNPCINTMASGPLFVDGIMYVMTRDQVLAIRETH